MKAALLGIFALMFVASTYAIDGSFSVLNNGGYVAKFTLSYNLNGQQKYEDSGDFTLGFTKEIRIPDGATNVVASVQEYWFYNALTTIFTESFDGPVRKCYKIWGTTLSPQYGSIDC